MRVTRVLVVAVSSLAFTVFGVPTATADPRAPDVACPNGELDRCFNEAQMQDFLNVGQRMVDGFLRQNGVGARPDVAYLPLFGGVGSDCGIQGDDAYAYCPGDRTIYIG